MTPRLVRGGEFAGLFTSFHRTAWRFETQLTYAEDYEQAELRRYLSGAPLDVTYLTDWLSVVRAATAAGRTFQRVRVVTEPLTDYLRFELAVAPHNVAAGEEIRLLPATQARGLRLPDHDFWLFDDSRLAIMQFERSSFVGAQLVDDAPVVQRHRVVRDTAWRHAEPFA